MTIRHLAHQLAQHRIGDLALFMGKDTQVLRNKLNFNSDSAHLYVQEFEQIVDFTDANFAVAEYFAAKCNAVVFQLPAIQDDGDMSLLDSYMQIMKEMGDLAAEFQKAYADGSIDRKEFTRIANEVTGVQARLLAFQSTVESKVV